MRSCITIHVPDTVYTSITSCLPNRSEFKYIPLCALCKYLPGLHTPTGTWPDVTQFTYIKTREVPRHYCITQLILEQHLYLTGKNPTFHSLTSCLCSFWIFIGCFCLFHNRGSTWRLSCSSPLSSMLHWQVIFSTHRLKQTCSSVNQPTLKKWWETH